MYSYYSKSSVNDQCPQVDVPLLVEMSRCKHLMYLTADIADNVKSAKSRLQTFADAYKD